MKKLFLKGTKDVSCIGIRHAVYPELGLACLKQLKVCRIETLSR